MNFSSIRPLFGPLRNLPRSAARRWPALAVASLAVAVPTTIAMAQDFPGFNTFGPSKFSLKGHDPSAAGAAIAADGQASGGLRNGLNASGQMGVDAQGTLFGVRASAQPGTNATGLRAEASQVAVSAVSFNERAVVGNGLKVGVEGVGTGGDTSIGVRGASGTGVRAEGIGNQGIGVNATAAKTAVKASSTNGTGVESSGASGGVFATASDGTGVIGVGNGQFGIGVIGNGLDLGVRASSPDGTGLSASSNTGIGASFSGGAAPIQLAPSLTSGAPKTGTHHRGELYVDNQGQLFLCTADSTAGNAGTWKHVHLDP
jgi:hypothetical protein